MPAGGGKAHPRPCFAPPGPDSAHRVMPVPTGALPALGSLRPLRLSQHGVRPTLVALSAALSAAGGGWSGADTARAFVQVEDPGGYFARVVALPQFSVAFCLTGSQVPRNAGFVTGALLDWQTIGAGRLHLHDSALAACAAAFGFCQPCPCILAHQASWCDARWITQSVLHEAPLSAWPARTEFLLRHLRVATDMGALRMVAHAASAASDGQRISAGLPSLAGLLDLPAVSHRAGSDCLRLRQVWDRLVSGLCADAAFVAQVCLQLPPWVGALESRARRDLAAADRAVAEQLRGLRASVDRCTALKNFAAAIVDYNKAAAGLQLVSLLHSLGV